MNNHKKRVKTARLEDQIDSSLPAPYTLRRLQMMALQDIRLYEMEVSQYLYNQKVVDLGNDTDARPITMRILSTTSRIRAETDALNNASNHQALFEHFRKKVFARYGLKGEVTDAQIDSLDIESKEKTKLKNLLVSGSFYDFACKEGICEPYETTLLKDEAVAAEFQKYSSQFEALYQARVNAGLATMYYMQNALTEKDMPSLNFEEFRGGNEELDNILSQLHAAKDENMNDYITAVYTSLGRGAAASYMMDIMKQMPLYVDLCHQQRNGIARDGKGYSWNHFVSWNYGKGPYVAEPIIYQVLKKEIPEKLKTNPKSLGFQMFLTSDLSEACLASYVEQERLVQLGKVLPEHVTKYHGTRMATGKTLSDIIYANSTSEDVRIIDTTNGLGVAADTLEKDTVENHGKSFIFGVSYDMLLHHRIAGWASRTMGIKIGGGAASLGISFLVGLGIDWYYLSIAKEDANKMRDYITETVVPKMNDQTEKLRQENASMEGKSGTYRREQLIKALTFLKESYDMAFKNGNNLNQEQLATYECIEKALESLTKNDNSLDAHINASFVEMELPETDTSGDAFKDTTNKLNDAARPLHCEMVKNQLYTTALSFYETHQTLTAENDNAKLSYTPSTREADSKAAYAETKRKSYIDTSLFSTIEQNEIVNIKEIARVDHRNYYFQPALKKTEDVVLDRIRTVNSGTKTESSSYQMYRYEIMHALTEGRSLKTTTAMPEYATPYYNTSNRGEGKEIVCDGLFVFFTAKIASRDTNGDRCIPQRGEYQDITGPVNRYSDLAQEGVLTTEEDKKYYDFLQTVRSAARSRRFLQASRIDTLFLDRQKRIEAATTDTEKELLADIFRAEKSVCADILYIYQDAFLNSREYRRKDFIEFCKKDPFLKDYVTDDGKIDTKELFSFDPEDQTRRYDVNYQKDLADKYEERCLNIIKSIETYRHERVRRVAFEGKDFSLNCYNMNDMINEKIAGFENAYQEDLTKKGKPKDSDFDKNRANIAKAFYVKSILDCFSVSDSEQSKYLKEFGIEVDPIQFFASKKIDLKDAFKKAEEGDFSSFETDEFKDACAEYSKKINASKLNQERDAPTSENSNTQPTSEQERTDNARSQSTTSKKEATLNQAVPLETQTTLVRDNITREQEKICDKCVGILNSVDADWYGTITDRASYAGKMAVGITTVLTANEIVKLLQGKRFEPLKQFKPKKDLVKELTKLGEKKLNCEEFKKFLIDEVGFSEQYAHYISEETFKELSTEGKTGISNMASVCSEGTRNSFVYMVREINKLPRAERIKELDNLCKNYGFSNYDRNVFLSLPVEDQEKFISSNFEMFEVRTVKGGFKRFFRFGMSLLLPITAGVILAECLTHDEFVPPKEVISQACMATGLSAQEVEKYFSQEATVKSLYMLDVLKELNFLSEADWNKYRCYILDEERGTPEKQYKMRRALLTGYEDLEKTGLFKQPTNDNLRRSQARGLVSVLENFRLPADEVGADYALNGSNRQHGMV